MRLCFVQRDNCREVYRKAKSQVIVGRSTRTVDGRVYPHFVGGLMQELEAGGWRRVADVDIPEAYSDVPGRMESGGLYGWIGG